ncbi:MAG: cupredoxin domain-containing protein [Dehalococcoidia bacterium]
MNLTRTTTRAAFALIILGVVAALFGACANSSPPDPTPVTTFAITPAPPGYTPPPVSTFAGGAAPAATAAPAGTPVAGTPAAATPASGSATTTLKLVGQNLLFDKAKLTAPAGTVTIAFNNKDGGVSHDVRVFKGTDATGASVGATALAPGPVQQTLTLQLSPGTYYYHCDAHPTTMSGTLTVT